MHKISIELFYHLNDNICSILGDDFIQMYKKHGNNNQDIDFDEPVDELKTLEDKGNDVKLNEQDDKEIQNTRKKNENYDYNGSKPDNDNDGNFEDEEKYPLEYDQSDLEEDEDNGKYDDKEQDYWNNDSEKETESEDEEQGNEKVGQSSQGILIYRA